MSVDAGGSGGGPLAEAKETGKRERQTLYLAYRAMPVDEAGGRMTQVAAAKLAGVDSDTVTRWKREDEQFRAKEAEARTSGIGQARKLAEVDGLAKGWRDGRSLRALNDAAERLALAAPVAVGKLIERLKSDDEAIILRAAIAILDRAGLETAAKSSQAVDVSKLSDEELQRIIAGKGRG